ncbi:hypothetical protein K501DRAFT_267800 [Backusella circina FSU 941]|nr:hypothetical protein K501DRAFT_267800 [Backusella circina FSU 941]
MVFNKGMLIMMVTSSIALVSAASDWFPFSASYMQCNDEFQKCTVQFDKSYYLEWDAVKKNLIFDTKNMVLFQYLTLGLCVTLVSAHGKWVVANADNINCNIEASLCTVSIDSNTYFEWKSEYGAYQKQ